MATLTCKNPATGDVIREIETTPLEKIPELFQKAHAAQARWAALTPQTRGRALLQLRETFLNHVDDLSDLITQETGKPRFEALMNEVFASVSTIHYYAKKGPKLLRDEKIKLAIMKHRKSYLNYWPLGVVAVISPWNFPLLLPLGEIVMALVAGNAVIFKPSEVTPLVGLRIQELCGEAGLPTDLIQTVIGDGAAGAAIIQNKPSKIFFTGSVLTGKKIMAAAAEHLIPVNLELGGKDAMIVLPDADLDFATSAALWGSFCNTGQACASTERILVHESVAPDFLNKLRLKTEQLRIGSSVTGPADIGAITLEKQKLVYTHQLDQARKGGADFLTGGTFSTDRRFISPTIVTGKKIEELEIYNEETFGPIVTVTTFKSISEAVEKANQSRYGLLGSVITRNLSLGEEIAKKLEVGTVTINEVLYTAGLPETPWGGVKDSGIGRTHSDRGIYEFVNTRHIHKPRSSLFVFKSPWWYPYSTFQYSLFRSAFDLYRRHWIDKLRAVPHFLMNVVQFLKHEKRI